MKDQRQVAEAWRRLMLADDGTVLPDAEIVLRDLEAKCGWMVTSLPVDGEGRVDPLATAAALERRVVYAHVKARLFGPLPERRVKDD
jgi:hypothetical protein